MVFKAMYQLVLLYSSESWMVTWEMIKVMEGFVQAYHEDDVDTWFGRGV